MAAKNAIPSEYHIAMMKTVPIVQYNTKQSPEKLRRRPD
jgi:hypothetical protein